MFARVSGRRRASQHAPGQWKVDTLKWLRSSRRSGLALGSVLCPLCTLMAVVIQTHIYTDTNLNNITQAPCTHKPIPAFVQSRIHTTIYPSNLDAYSTHNVMFLSIAHSLTPHDHTQTHCSLHLVFLYIRSPITHRHHHSHPSQKEEEEERRKVCVGVWVCGVLRVCGCELAYHSITWRGSQFNVKLVSSV